MPPLLSCTCAARDGRFREEARGHACVREEVQAHVVERTLGLEAMVRGGQLQHSTCARGHAPSLIISDQESGTASHKDSGLPKSVRGQESQRRHQLRGCNQETASSACAKVD